MADTKLHIISFDVPFPPIYGGIIDVFYKIKALHEHGVLIYLHVYDIDKGEQLKLNQFCEQVYYYPRIMSLSKIFSRVPFIIKTRTSQELIFNLKKIDAPILFEGLHTTFPLISNSFINRKLLFRAHNIEHNYYNGLASSEKSKLKKLFFKTESEKLKRFEPILNKVDHILAISPLELNYFNKTYKPKTTYIPAFHQNMAIKNHSLYGDYAFYHGDLRVSDNIKSVQYLIKIFSKLSHKLVIAGGIINNMLIEEISNYPNIKFELINSDEHLIQLLQNAHVNVLTTYQNTGIKLKLINSLFNSRFCLVNNNMIQGTGLEELCTICNSVDSFRKNINILFKTEYSSNHQLQRTETLKRFDNSINAKLIIELLD